MHPITSTDILSILAIFQLPICAYAGLITQTSFHPTTILKQSDTNSVLGIPNAIIPEGVSLGPTSFDPASANHRSPPATDEFVNDLDTVHDIDTIRGRRLPFITSGVSGVESISAWLSSLGPDGRWPDSEINYATGCDAQRANWPAQVHWQRVLTMSAAFYGGTTAPQWVNNTTLRSGITRAMDFWFARDFTNPRCIDSGGTSNCPCGTPGFWNTNWFSNIIGIPRLIAQSCLLLGNTLSPTQRSNCTNVSSRSFAQFGRNNINGLGTLTGANTLDVAAISIDGGLLTANETQIRSAYGRVHSEVVIQNALRADGIRADGSFGQHGGIIYNGNYGKDYVNDVLLLEIIAGGTQFQAGDESRGAFATLIDGDQWMIYRNVITNILHWDFSVLNRFISFPVADNQATGSIKFNITQLQVLGQQWNSSILTNVYENLSKTSSDANVGNLTGNRMFFANDYMVHRGEGFVSTLKMYSSRTSNSECINSQNPFGFHLSDGTLYTYITGSEYEDIAAAWDWNLIPGTTVDYGATSLTCSRSQFSGVETFVGGVTDGQSGIGVMRYRNPSTNNLTWQKAWFFGLGGEVHVMVNSISSRTNAQVFSVLDQRKKVSDIIVDGSSAQSGNYTNVSRLWHGGVGYVFPRSIFNSGVSLSINTGTRTGSWASLGISTQPPATVNLFAAWLAHGSGPSASSTVSYTAYPATKDYTTFVHRASIDQTTQIRNDEDASAVYDNARNVAYIVFWQDGSEVTLESPASDSNGDSPVTIGADVPLVLILHRAQSPWVLYVSDPSQTLSGAQVTLSLTQGEAPVGWPGGSTRSIIVEVVFPDGGTAGDTVKVILS